MKAKLTSGAWVDLGADNVRVLERAARLLKKGVFAVLIIETPVPCAGWTYGHSLGGFRALADAGLLSRDEQLVGGMDDDYYGHDIRYTVIENVVFKDTDGGVWAYGSSQLWAK